MNGNRRFWQEWWDAKADRARSDLELDRGVAEQSAELQKKAEQQFLSSLRAAPGDHVLDVGCGTGVNIQRVAPLVRSVVGIDLSTGMLFRARERVASHKLANVRLMQGDITRLEFESDSFHKVICTSVAQYLNKNECKQAIDEMVRVCKTGGTIILHVKNSRSLYGLSLTLLKPLARLFGRKIQPDFYRSANWYEQSLENCGCTVETYDSFGIFTFVPLSRPVVRAILALELKYVRSKWLKKFGVNYQMSIRVGAKRSGNA